MKPLAIRVRSFKSFTEEQEFRFPDGPGLYFLTGRNEAQPRLGANGTGKSTLWQALFWLFFEKTSEGLKAGDLSPWSGEKGTRVEFDYEDDGQLFTLGRTWSPNRWYLIHDDGADELLVKDSSNAAVDHLGAKAETFLYSILMAQGSDMFLDLKPEAATNLFSQVMDLDRWLDASSKASKRAAAQDVTTRSLESETSRLRGQLESLRGDDLEVTSDEWESNRNAKLDTLEQEHAQHSALRRAAKEELKPADERAAYLSREVAKTRRNLSELNERSQGDGEVSLRKFRSQEAVIEFELKELEVKIEEALHAGTCSQCGQDLPKALKEENTMRLMNRRDDLKDEQAELATKIEKLENSERVRQNSIRVLNATLDEQLRNLQFAELDVRQLSSKVGQEDKILDRIEEQAEDLANQKNPVTGALRALEDKRKRLMASLAEAEAELLESESKYRLYQFWVKGFKDIRLAQVSEALTQLEIEVNNCITQLGLVGWSIRFDSDSETKSGNLKRGFSVKVLSPSNDKPVPWKSWSGGEAQRLRLAGNMGLANLIRDRAGISLPLEVWDEPTQFLSPQGVNDLLDSLAERAKTEKRQIWVVDHRSLGYGSFNGAVTVVKNHKGSFFEKRPV